MSEKPTPGATSSIEDQIRLREEKARDLRARGQHPYGNAVQVGSTAEHVKEVHGGDTAEVLEKEYTPAYSLAGRVMAIRTMGKVTFLSLRDRTGDLQAFIKKDKVGEEAYEALKLLDLGDIAWVRGRAMRTKTGELSIEADQGGFRLLTKALRPLPEKWHGLSDVETRYRQRYVDLAVNPQVREAFRRRAKLISGLRRALDLTLKLRIATELHLKRLIVGGLERVYEVGRIFRNEGIDRKHNPEFTMVEFYQAYATYEDLMKLTEELIARLALEVTGNLIVPYQGVEIDWRPPWPRVSMVGEVAKAYGVGGSSATEQLDGLARLSREQWAAKVTDREHLNKLARTASTGEQIAWAFEALMEPKLPEDRPVFVVDHPIEVSPLARKRDSEPRLVDRFEAFAGGMEIANAFSELNDPRDQEARFRAQVEAARRGDQEAMPYDHDYVRALEHGMPPTAGEGIGIDRLAMLFTDSPSIRDVVLFPLLKPEQGEGA